MISFILPTLLSKGYNEGFPRIIPLSGDPLGKLYDHIIDASLYDFIDKMVMKLMKNEGLMSGTSMNVLYLVLFILLFVIVIYLLYLGMTRGIDLIFPKGDLMENLDGDDGSKEDMKEKFTNFSIDEFLLQFNDDGEYVGNGDEVGDDMGDDVGDDVDEAPKKVVDHPKNREVKERSEKEDSSGESKSDPMAKTKDSEKVSQEAIVFCVDKSKSEKDYHFTILNDKSLRYLELNGYQDAGNVILQVKDVKKNDVTKIKNKIYNKYEMIYQTRDDRDPQTYYLEYRPNQERFMKVANSNEDKILYLEKIQSREGGDQGDRYGAFPLYAIYEFAEKIGTVYLIENQTDREMRKYAIVVNPEKKNHINLLAFALSLYLSLSR
jgi:hypothetical protein